MSLLMASDIPVGQILEPLDGSIAGKRVRRVKHRLNVGTMDKL